MSRCHDELHYGTILGKRCHGYYDVARETGSKFIPQTKDPVSFAKQLKNSSDVHVYILTEKKKRFNLKFEQPFKLLRYQYHIQKLTVRRPDLI